VSDCRVRLSLRTENTLTGMKSTGPAGVGTGLVVEGWLGLETQGGSTASLMIWSENCWPAAAAEPKGTAAACRKAPKSLRGLERVSMSRAAVL
jgi:hypothetical protein